jgi:polyisoprenoid-binding protein YceI
VKIPAGTYRLGPGHGRLTVNTGRTGAAAKAGHNLTIDVSAWDATVVAGDDPADTRIELEADGASLKVLQGVGGMQALGEDDKADIEKTIHDDVLKKQSVRFASTSAVQSGDNLTVTGDLTLNKQTHPITFDVAAADDGTLSATTVIKQSDWGMKPYSTLFGALKVVDEVQVSIAAKLP